MRETNTNQVILVSGESGRSVVLRFPPPIKPSAMIIDITEILLKVGLNTTIPHNYM
jgi:hypothetical protein